MNNKIFKKIKEIVGKRNCLESREDRICYSYDAGMISNVPDMVVLPENSMQVAEIMKICNAEGISLYPRGAGSGMVGASVPVEQGVVISMAKFNRISSVSVNDLQAVAGPGVITGELQKAVEQQGMFYPPDPASLRFCTLGGNINTGAGGARAVKYGVTRDYVISLELCLADGNIINTGSSTAKGVAGYDLTRLIVGSEGTLGIVTSITLRLIPMPESKGTLLAFFKDTASAASTISCLFADRILPRCAEFLDKKSIRCIAKKLPTDVNHDARAMLLIEVDGPAASIKGQIDAVQDCLEKHSAISTLSADTPAMVDAIWAARRSLSPALKQLGFRHKINEDICVPRHALPEMMHQIEAIENNTGVVIVTFGHAGDGNLHVNVMHNGMERNGFEPADRAVNDIMGAAVSLGGTISGEHGVGLAKRSFMPIEFPAASMEIMQGIKRAFDPCNILNPYKKLPFSKCMGG